MAVPEVAPAFRVLEEQVLLIRDTMEAALTMRFLTLVAAAVALHLQVEQPM